MSDPSRTVVAPTHTESESQPVQIGETFADVMGRATGCPNLRCDNTQPPRAAVPLPDGGWMASFLCADCDTAWTTDWKDD